MHTILVTGANRGLGLAFCKYYLEQGDYVIACSRQGNSANLRDLSERYSKALFVIQLDVSNANEIKNLTSLLLDKRIDILINNAGIYQDDDTDYTSENLSWWEVFSVNAVAPYLIAHALKDSVQQSKQRKIINISSSMGSITLNNNAQGCSYRASKAALNAITKNLSIELAERNIIVAAIDPGWVKTDMGGLHAKLTIEESVFGMVKIIEHLSSEESGKFISYNGVELAW